MNLRSLATMLLFVALSLVVGCGTTTTVSNPGAGAVAIATTPNTSVSVHTQTQTEANITVREAVYILDTFYDSVRTLRARLEQEPQLRDELCAHQNDALVEVNEVLGRSAEHWTADDRRNVTAALQILVERHNYTCHRGEWSN